MLSITGAAQSALLNHTYSFSKGNYTLYELTVVMQQQADISISYDAHKIKSNTKITLPRRIMTAKELTVLLNKKYHIKSRFIGKHIVLQKEREPVTLSSSHKAKPKKKVLPEQKQPERNIPPVVMPEVLSVDIPEIILPEEQYLDTITYFADTFAIDSTTIVRYGWEVGGAGAAFATLNKDVDRLDEPEVTKVYNSWYERLGLALNLYGDEIFNFNPAVTVHWSNFSITGVYAIRRNLSHFRLGLAYTIPVNKNVGISIWGNYGRIPDQHKVINYQYDSINIWDPDSPSVIITGSVPYTLKGTLIKAGVNVDWKIGNKLTLFGGFTFNNLRGDILNNSRKEPPRMFIPPAVALREEDFQPFPTILTITDDFSFENSSYTRNWLGFQLGIRFYLVSGKNN